MQKLQVSVSRPAAAAVVAVVAAAVSAMAFGDAMLGTLEGAESKAFAKLGRRLLNRHGLAFYAPLDEEFPMDFISMTPFGDVTAERVPGAVGYARRFSGRRHETLASPFSWVTAGRAGFSVSFFAKIRTRRDGRESRLLWVCGNGARVGVRVLGGALEASFSDSGGVRTMSAPAPRPGVFVHVALSVGTDRAALFLDGVEVASRAVSAPLALPPRQLEIGGDGCHFPPDFDMDELCVWNRPLAGREVRRFAASRRPVPRLLSPWASARVRFFSALASSMRTAVSSLGRLGAAFAGRPGSSAGEGVPVLDLRFSASDLRHFRDAHSATRGSGFRPRKASRARRAGASFRGRDADVLAWLDESVFPASLSMRPAFVLSAPAGFLGPGPVRLYPPEQYGERVPDAARPLPLSTNSLVRLEFNGEYYGLYVLEPFEADVPAWFATGARDVSRPDRLHFSTPLRAAAAGAGMDEGRREAAWRGMLRLLMSDTGFPLGSPEARALAVRHARRRFRLELPDPEARPSSGEPRLPDGSGGLPSLSLWIGRPLLGGARTEFSCLLAPAGGGAALRLSGTGPCGGGAKLRGNTSYLVGRRRSMNLKFDAPVAFPQSARPVRHLLLLSGYSDASRLRNAFSYHVFNAMSAAAGPRATTVGWAETSFNGRPGGVWEFCPRLEDAVGERFSELYKVRSGFRLWEDPDATAEDVSRVGGGARRDADPDPYGPIRRVARFVSSTSDADFASRASSVFDVGELVDFFLLVNFTGNEDGLTANQFIGRRADDGRWLLLPWDCDKTFRPGRVASRLGAGRSPVLTNPLFRRLFSTDPELFVRAERRWRELRSGPLSDVMVDRWIDEREALLCPLMDGDYALTPPLGHDGGFADAVRAFREEAHASAAWLDKWLESEAAANSARRAAGSPPCIGAGHALKSAPLDAHHMKTTGKENAKGGRPTKFDGPSTRVTLTLPNRTLDALSEIGDDRAKAVVKAVDAALGRPLDGDADPSGDPVRQLPFGPGESLLCLSDNRLLRSIPWLSLVEIAPGRHVIALDGDITVEKFEVAVNDLLDEPPPGTRKSEIAAVRSLLQKVRGPRRRSVLRTTSLLVVPEQ